jgi:hypothetical protein
LIRISSLIRAISCRSRLFSVFRRILALMLLAATLRANVREKCAREMAWMTADRMRLGQPLGKGILGLSRMEPPTRNRGVDVPEEG